MPEASLYQNGKLLCKTEFTAPCTLSALTELIPRPCGGKGYCGKCRVQVRGNVSRMTSAEHEKLTKTERAQGYRLACQAMATGNVSIFLPDTANIEKASMAEIQSVHPMGQHYGFVFDLGTTMICAALYHLPSGRKCGEKHIANPQFFYGADVLSRIDCAMHGDGARLSRSVQHALFDVCAALLTEQRLAPNDADAAVLVGNTAMLYLLFGLDPVSISRAPFQSETLFGQFYPADFLPVRKGTKLYIPPCISAFLGADTTAAVLGSRLHETENAVLADLGTNAELILHTDGKYFGCSCAAGPAFEGAGLSCGMAATDGAVCSVQLSGGYFSYQTVGNAAPKGFCGSGLIDLIAAMKRVGAIDADGKLSAGERFYLSDTPLYITQQDVRAFQLAKSAVRTGLEILLSRSATEDNQLYLAGTFGSFLRLSSAVQIGLLPPILQSRSFVCGNAAGTGGAVLLLDQDNIRAAEKISASTETVQLADLPEFQDMLLRYTALKEKE